MGDIIAFSDSFPDDRLRLIFTSAHPAIAPDIRTALALRTICGVAMDRLAAAFLMPTATLYQRQDWWRWTPSTRQVSRIIAAGSARAGIYWPKRARSNRPPKRWTAPWRWAAARRTGLSGGETSRNAAHRADLLTGPPPFRCPGLLWLSVPCAAVPYRRGARCWLGAEPVSSVTA